MTSGKDRRNECSDWAEVTSLGRFGLRVGGHPALSLHSSDEPGELSQWLCHDDSTINIVVVIIIIIIIIVQDAATGKLGCRQITVWHAAPSGDRCWRSGEHWYYHLRRDGNNHIGEDDVDDVDLCLYLLSHGTQMWGTDGGDL